MRTIFNQPTETVSSRKSTLLAIAAHASLALLLVGGISRSVQVKSYRLPGTAQGISYLTYYAPGSAHPVQSNTPVKSKEKPKPTASKHDEVAPPAQAKAEPDTKAGAGNASDSGLGEGDITIALQTYFPYPKPDLSTLPHGTHGNVILNAVIDEQGNIKQLTLVKGLDPKVDQSVIATVQQWHYTPAMRHGVPVASEQELHFYYERG
jgi:protein TonB